MKIDLEIGDTILTGRFKNKPMKVKQIGTDDKGQPTINGRPMLKFRIKKLMPEQNLEEQELRKIIREHINKILDSILNEDYSQRARNFRVHLRTRLKDMKPGKKVKIDKLFFKKLPSGDGFTDNRGKFFDLEQVVQAIQKGPAAFYIRQNSVRSPRGKEQVDAYLKFEGKLSEAKYKVGDTVTVKTGTNTYKGKIEN